LSNDELKTYSNLIQNTVYCEISIQDNGIGFDQQYSNQIFLIFHRLHGQKEFSGTGIGLALCKKIVANHSGEIFAESNETEGALFRILLPLTHRVNKK
jgi:light-regulated signal transduction histidine kinase (bacteriophytochrome)